jgi:alpha/beta superfamily hydrolase
MDMEVVLALEEALVGAGFATLRYNSRGIGGSEGSVSQVEANKLVVPEGEAEMLDVGAALRFLAGQSGVNGEKLALVGHSFGARIALAYLAEHPEERGVAAVACIGLAVAWRDLSSLGKWPHPKLFVTAERDDFSPPELLKEFVEGLPEPANVVVLKRTGHFFEGREHDLADVVTAFLRRVIG